MSLEKGSKFFACSLCGSKFGDRKALEIHGKECLVCLGSRVTDSIDMINTLMSTVAEIAKKVSEIEDRFPASAADQKKRDEEADDEAALAAVIEDEPVPEKEVRFSVMGKDLYRLDESTKKWIKVDRLRMNHLFHSLICKRYAEL